MRLPFPLLLAATVAACSSPSQPQHVGPEATPENGFLSTATLDEKRVGQLLPLQGSEDARHLLRYTPPAVPADTATSYYANPRYDWVLPLTLRRPLGQHQLRQLLDQPRRETLDYPQVYGRATRTGRWTYALAGTDADSVFTALALGWKLYNVRTPEPHPLAAAQLQAWQQATLALAPQLEAQAGQPSLPAAQAAQLSTSLSGFVIANDQLAVIVLRADHPFAGRPMWDALLSLGLRWGDEDLFHWDNPQPDSGSGDYLFDVSTSTPPGYFLPEQVAAGRMNPADLRFSFSIPRTAAPEQVLASMHRAASYCQRRLGGHLLNEAGQPFDLSAATRQCQQVQRNLRRQHLSPGVGDALYLF